MRHAAAAQHGHPQEEARHQAIQGPSDWSPAELGGSGGGGEAPFILVIISPGGALLAEERGLGVVFRHGADWPVPGGSREGSPQALPTPGHVQRELPQEDDGRAAGGPGLWGAVACSPPRCGSPQAASGFDEKLQAYGEVCRDFRPVFRYFCMERFLDPAVWMEKRLAYTRSVATSSIGTDRCWQLGALTGPTES